MNDATTHEAITVHLKIWRQARGESRGKFATYTVDSVLPEMSLLEVLDILNEDLTRKGEQPVEFDSDCREGICGTCGLVIQGVAHGPHAATTTCEVRMRRFGDGETITVEPWRAGPFPIVKDLVVDRSSFDRIQTKGGYVSTNIGSAPDANAVPIAKDHADKAMDAASCIGCGPRPLSSSAPRSASFPTCPRARPNAAAAPWPWSIRWTRRVSATVRITASVRRSAPRRSPSRTSPACGASSSREPSPRSERVAQVSVSRK